MPEWPVQRRFPRYVIQLPILGRANLDPLGQAGAGWTRDLSEGGACLELAESLQLRTPMHLFLRTDRGRIELQAQVIWVAEPSRSEGGILHGVSFIQLAPEQVRALRDLIRAKGQMQRAGVRVPLEVVVTCTPLRSSRPPLQGLTADASRGGLLLLLPEVVAPGSTLQIGLQIPSGPLTVEGTVVWVEPPGGRAVGPPFRHGFRFTTLRWPTSLSLGLFLTEAK